MTATRALLLGTEAAEGYLCGREDRGSAGQVAASLGVLDLDGYDADVIVRVVRG